MSMIITTARNTNLKALIDSVMSQVTPSQFHITLTLTSQSNSSWTYRPMMITSLTLDQLYSDNYMDVLHIQFQIALADYAKLYDNAQNLFATLQIDTVDRFGKKVLSIAPIKKSYRAVVVDLIDVRRQFPDADARTVPDTPLKIHLIEPELYNIRQQKINAVYQTATLIDVIHHVTQAFNISTAYIVDPDNTHTYDHVVLPPLQSFSDVFYYLHAKYGLYANGCNHYYTSGVMYLYPPFKTDPQFPYTATFYQANEGDYAGASCFHRISGKNIEIVLNNLPPTKDLSVHAAENIGTASMMLRASQLIDGMINVSQKTIKFNQDNAVAIRLNQSRLADSQNVHSTYTKATDNPFVGMSLIASKQAQMLVAQWTHAIPFSLSPGQNVIYYSSQNGVTQKRTGIIEAVTYIIQQGERVGPDILMACMAQIYLRLAPQATTVTL